MRLPRLAHQPVKLVVALAVNLVPVGAEADHPEMQRLQPLEGRLVIEPKVSGAQRTEADADLHRGDARYVYYVMPQGKA